MSKTNYRIGHFVPSSNTTMETEIPAMLRARDRTGLPVASSSVSTTFMMLKNLGLKTVVPNAGALLSGKY